MALSYILVYKQHATQRARQEREKYIRAQRGGVGSGVQRCLSVKHLSAHNHGRPSDGLDEPRFKTLAASQLTRSGPSFAMGVV